MKKIITIIASLAIIMAMFTGCTSTGSAMKDGTYKAKYATADDHGWTDYVDVTVSGGKITAVDYDSLDKDGNKKSESQSYEETMKKSGSKTWPSEFMKSYENKLIEKQNVNDVDAVAGATNSFNDFRKLVKSLEANMKKGETTTVEVTR